MTNNKIPQPAVIRLCSIYQLLCRLAVEGVLDISSTELEEKTGVPSHTIRKDINFLGEVGTSGKGYEVAKLKGHLESNLGLNKKRKACIVGLGRLGSAILQSQLLAGEEFRIVAGFDSNINVLETITTPISVYPSYEIAEIVRRMEIELAVLAVPPAGAQEAVERLVEGGVRGIVNFAPVIIKPKRKGVFVRNIDITGELRILSAEIINSKLEPLTTKQ